MSDIENIDPNSKPENTVNDTNDTENISLDAIVKSLLKLSPKCIVGTLNNFFDLSLDPDTVIIKPRDGGFQRADLNYDEIEADSISEIDKKLYHLEIQTIKDKSMPSRMVGYGISLAQETYEYIDGKLVLTMPYQAVLYLEENKNIEDVEVKIIFPNNTSVEYAIPTKRLWEFSIGELHEREMYNLLPLKVFSHRKKLKYIASKKNISEEEKLRQITAEKEHLLDTIRELHGIMKNILPVLEDNDVHSMFLAMTNIVENLNHNFIKDDKFKVEVIDMTKTFYDPAVEERGIIKGIDQATLDIAKKALINGANKEFIASITGLSYDEIEELKESL